MNKKSSQKIFFFILTVFATVFLSSILFDADAQAADYNVSSYQSTLNIQKNQNSAIFNQDLTYRFQGEHNGIFINQLASKANEKGFKISLLKLQVYNSTTKQWQELFANNVQNSSNNYWTLQKSINQNPVNDPFYAQLIANPNQAVSQSPASGSLQLKLYDHVLPGQKIKVRLSWQLINLVSANTKIDELNWLPISSWNCDINHFSLKINLPTAAKTLKGWVHTQAGVNGNITLSAKTGMVAITAAKIPANNKLEVHSYWNKAITNFPALHQNNDRAAQIDKQEAAITFRSHVKTGVLLVICLILAPLMFLAAAIKLIKTNHKLRKDYKQAKQLAGVDKTIVHDFEIPNDLGPAVITARLDPENFDKTDPQKGRLVSATFMDLIARKQITIADNAAVNSKKIMFNYAAKNDKQPSYESTILRTFFPKQTDSSFNSADLKNSDSKINQRIRANLPTFTSQVKQASDQQSIIDKNKTQIAEGKLNSAQAIFLLLSITGLAAIIIATFVSQIMIGFIAALIYLLLSIVIYVMYCKAPTLYYTNDGFQEKYRWDGFKKMLHDIGHFDSKQVLDVKIWDRILAYAVVFNEAEHVAKYLRATISEDQIKASSMPLLFSYYYYPMWQINDSISATSIPTPSKSGNWSGGGGGFSSGGGFSGGGGGGGGGAF